MTFKIKNPSAVAVNVAEHPEKDVWVLREYRVKLPLTNYKEGFLSAFALDGTGMKDFPLENIVSVTAIEPEEQPLF